VIKGQTSRVKGQSLFEVVVALAIITLILVAIVALGTLSIRNISFSRNQTLATRLAQTTVEWLRGERDEDWSVFRDRAAQAPTPSLPWCLTSLEWPTTPRRCGASEDVAGTIFSREVYFPGSLDVNAIHAEVVISWVDAQGFHEAKSSTFFTNWRTN